MNLTGDLHHSTENWGFIFQCQAIFLVIWRHWYRSCTWASWWSGENNLSVILVNKSGKCLWLLWECHFVCGFAQCFKGTLKAGWALWSTSLFVLVVWAWFLLILTWVENNQVHNVFFMSHVLCCIVTSSLLWCHQILQAWEGLGLASVPEWDASRRNTMQREVVLVIQ